jgi:hypothetical protein
MRIEEGEPDMSAIRSKREFYRLWHAGLLGNRPRTWAGRDELMRAFVYGWRAPVVIRSAVIPGWQTMYDVPITRALDLAMLTPGLTFNECLDECEILLQGEVMRGERGLELTGSRLPKKMKIALAEMSEHHVGLAAKLLLDRYLSPASRDDIEALFDLYPDAVIEFGAYSRNVGDQPHRNTLIWEVRNY